ncbi:hypothetical protein PPN31114_00280 [Pandoraea pneumonica]|jgi:hypothetical protein|uniref:Uncharacterized protein n=1 Tax=Pandoraea pneumonica TaxID=2508299 RepID=A0A5E4RRB7_9BURK|nr:hypothetical protein [Pandoraea pneumonica]VVD64589.1 hypothetical protein PPN31114_00280 [Pandoraea pneumonica]
MAASAQHSVWGFTVSALPHRILICQPTNLSTPTTAIDTQLCPPEGDQQFAVVSIPPSQTSMTSPQLDIPQMAGFWTLAFATVIGLWFVSAQVGAIVGFIRRG